MVLLSNLFGSSQIFVLLEKMVYFRPPGIVRLNVDPKHHGRDTVVILSSPQANEESLNSVCLQNTEILRGVYPERS
jgi:hypothetical protein